MTSTEETLSNLLKEDRRFEPPEQLAADANLKEEAYQAARAVAMPTQPPSFVMPSVVVKSPIAMMMKVAVSSTNTARTAPLTRVAATDMYAVKRPHASR